MIKLVLRPKGQGLFFAFLMIFGFGLHAQNLKTRPSQKGSLKTIYKKSKIYDSKTGPKRTKLQRVADNAIDRLNYEFDKVKNPYTGKVEKDIRELELKFSSKISQGTELKKSISTLKSSNNRFSYWVNRGPFNVGGRTRALAIDRSNENIILAAGVSGGLWRSTNSGQTWKKVTNSRQTPTITAIVQDPRPGRERTWYYGTGERFGSASAGGAFYGGGGIFKSTNGGLTWRILSVTDDDNVSRQSPFDIVNSMVMNPITGDLFVGTFAGIYRSQDEGNSFDQVLDIGFDNWGEIAIDASGQLYAAAESDGDPNAGFFTSTDDGNTWTDITPETLPRTFGRTVIGVDPSTEGRVYFLSRNIAPESEAFLYRYDEALEDSLWVDLSANLPTTIGGRVGSLNLQTGYNMVVKVHPTNPDMVFVGGTNLYRSTTGFTTPAAQESWIAGYSPLNDVSTYTNQHPDHHALVFYPSDPNRALSGNDGGVSITEDITATNDGIEPVSWTSLNNGYVTTHPYHVAFDPEANSDDLVAGFQDNGTWFTNSTDPMASWVEDFGGDGTYSAIADGGSTRYVSSQNANLFRINLDENGEFESFTKVAPAGTTAFSFVNPFILDPNNDNIMYMPVGNRIWRNSNLDEIPLFSFNNTPVNWTSLSNTQTPEGTRITAVDVSTFPIANRLYYGTNQGNIYKMNNATLDGQEVIDISSEKGLPPGNVNDINVDPSDPDRVIITFSNYGIPSLFLTEDGGESWTNISGNLEENPDGTGNGPSVRGSAFLGSSLGRVGKNAQTVFVATSTGLYTASRLNGERTRWRKESFVIGNAVANEVVTRKDGFVAVSAHGNGLFSARFPIRFNPLPESTLSVLRLIPDLNIDENSEGTEVDISELFFSSSNSPINIELVNTNPELVTAVLSENVISLSFKTDSLGQANIGLIATSGEERVATGFNVIISEPSIYEQANVAIDNSPSQFFVDFGALAQTADDFIVPQENIWTINRVKVFGGVNNNPALTNATVVIYGDNDGVPGEEIYNSGEVVPVSEAADPNLNIALPEEVALKGGKYWLAVYANLPFAPNQTQWFWSLQEGGIGAEPVFKDDFDLFGTGATDWTPISESLGRPLADMVFQIFGGIADNNPQEELLERSQEQPLATLENIGSSMIWPNPSSNSFMFNLKGVTTSKTVGFKVYDITGKLVFDKTGINTNTVFEWDASQSPSGFYMVKIIGKEIITVKILKN